MKTKNRIIIYLLIILSICSVAKPSMAEENGSVSYQAEQDQTDLIFVVDFSNSMNSNDKNKVALEMLSACIDSLYAEKIRVGFIAYNDQILSSVFPVPLHAKADRENLKQTIHSVTRSGNTDIGMALAEAQQYLLQHSLPEGRKGRIVLLSDGVPDLRYSRTGKTTQQSVEQMQAVAAQCQEAAIEIDCIAFGENFDGETSELFRVAEQSGGGVYTAKRPEVLVDIFGEIIAKTTFSKLRPISVTISGGEEKTVELPTINTFADEANVLVVSDSPLQDVTILYSGEEITYSRSNYYFTCKIEHLKNENLSLKMIGNKDQEIRIYLVLYKNFGLYLEASELADKNLEYQYQYQIKDLNTGQYMHEELLYQGLEESLIVSDGETSEVLAIQKPNQGQTRQIVINQSGTYQAEFSFASPYFDVAIPDIPIVVRNQAPEGEFAETLKYLAADQQEIFDLNQYFRDPNQDPLSFELEYLNGSGTEQVVIEGSQLIVWRGKKGRSAFIIKATDPEGAQAATALVTISVQSFWQYYAYILWGLVFVLLMITGYLYLLWRKRKIVLPVPAPGEGLDKTELTAVFHGKLNVYFIKTPEELEIEPLTFALHQIKEKKVTLGQLLECLDIPFKSFDPEQIFLQGGMEKELILSHKSNCSIMVGSSIICKRLNYAVAYSNKIYITSQDGEYELELHYLSLRS